MAIAHVESSEDLSKLVEELGEHSDEESMGVVEESDAKEGEDTASLQENYNSLLEKLGEYVHVAKAAVKKMKKAEENYRSLLMRHKEAKCEIERLNGEVLKAYSKVRFLEQEVMQANAKVERVSTKKLDEVISYQKNFSNKSRLGYTRGSSSSVKVTKEVKFVKATEPIVDASTPEKVKDEKKRNVADQRELNMPQNQYRIRSESQAKSCPRS